MDKYSGCANKLGVMVADEDVEALVGLRRWESGDMPVLVVRDLEVEFEGTEECRGEDGAETYSSNRDEEGVWYTEIPVRVVVMVPPNRERLVAREADCRLPEWPENRISMGFG